MMDQTLPKQRMNAEMSTVGLSPTTPTAEARRTLLSLFEQLAAAGPEALTAAARQELLSLHRKFRDSHFYLVFLGQFKRGKTTLLNGFLGADALPTGVLPLTSVVTVVKYGARACAKVLFASGATQEISTQQLSAYVTEKGNPHNRRKVSEVEVFYPAERLREGLCLVDTPGIGSLFEHNTQVSYQFVPRADAAIFVFSPEAPLSQIELDFLHHLRAHVAKIFFVLNKADQVSEAERTEILEFAQQAIRAQMSGGDLRFFPVSARQALVAQSTQDQRAFEASLLPRFLQALDRFLSAHGGDLLMQSTCAGLRRMVRDQLLGLELEQRALSLSSAELEEKIRVIEQAWQSLLQRHREIAPILRAEVRALESNLERALNDFARGEQPRLVTHLQRRLKDYRGTPKRRLASLLGEELRAQIAEILEEWKMREERVVAQAFEALTSRFSREATRTVEQIQQAAAEQFGFSWTSSPLPDRLTTQSEFRIRVDDLMTWGLGQFPFLLPKPLFSRYLEARVEQACLEELYRNAGRLKVDLRDRLEESVNVYLRALDRHVESARESILGTLSRAACLRESAEARTHQAIQTQSVQLALLKTLDEELSGLQGALGKRTAP